MDLKLDDVISWILSKNASKVAIQMPEGLKIYAQGVKSKIESETNAFCIICADPCFGACDYDTDFKQYADVLIQFGHSNIPSMNASSDVLFVEVFFDFEVNDIIEKILPELGSKIGLVSAVQYVNLLPKIQDILKAHGKEAIIGKGDSRVVFNGQILGCNISSALSADVDQYIYIGSGNFHPISISIETGKNLIVLDPQMNEVRELTDLKDKIFRQRYGAIARAQTAEHYLILASSKPGQIRMDKTIEMKKLLESKGKTADVIMMERFDPEYLLPFKADAYVSTACSRIAIDDYLRYDKPILTPIELEIVLGIRDWEDYHLDFF
ncbi:diphthamide biosynthesis enzyme Dph2 [Candidatus Methanomassiliicoccus intestinalis]|uniref:diphthamide biosynthesis enzyme Dph2 n=1 Tax=Candidatus Methanomassiliicoccus intestinalis TaxID=1406512 RepID=UPI0037DD0225